MGSKSKSKKKRHREEVEEDSTTASSSSSYSSESDSKEIERSSKRRKSSHKRRRSDDERRRREKRKREKEKRHSRRKERRKHSNSSSSKKSKRDGKKRYSDSDLDSGSGFESEGSGREEPEEVVKCILKAFPGVAGDLEQLLQMIDDGQAVDIKGLSEKSLVRHLRKLFLALNLKENGDKVFLLPPTVHPTLAVIQPIIRSFEQSQKQQLDHPAPQNDLQSTSPDLECRQERDETVSDIKDDSPAPAPAPAPRRRTIGPEMPSAELLAAAAKLTEAEAELREAELEEDTEFFIGPPPPAVVSEAQSANEAERFEEVTRIIGAEVDSPYDILGVNKNMSDENMKKRYWKLSLMVHPDKCSHPQAHQAFIKLNKAFKDLQDADKRKALDEKIKLKEQQEEFKAELQAMREAAQWRRLQGISMEGDDIILAEMNAEAGPKKRDEWMTALPPERKPGGMPMHSTTFSKNSKEGRGDTSAWTDTPMERAQKAKTSYLEAYNEATALASKEQDMKKANSEAELVDQYNKAKRSKTLVEQHKESARSRSKKKSKQESVKEEEWVGNHPWKPWDREKDLTAGRQNVKFDSESMAEGLSSRFSSGSFQRNFL